MKSLDIKLNAQYLVGLMLLLLPLLPIRQGGGMGLQHLQAAPRKRYQKMQCLAAGMPAWLFSCRAPRLTALKGLSRFLKCYHGTNK